MCSIWHRLTHHCKVLLWSHAHRDSTVGGLSSKTKLIKHKYHAPRDWATQPGSEGKSHFLKQATTSTSSKIKRGSKTKGNSKLSPNQHHPAHTESTFLFGSQWMEQHQISTLALTQNMSCPADQHCPCFPLPLKGAGGWGNNRNLCQKPSGPDQNIRNQTTTSKAGHESRQAHDQPSCSRGFHQSWDLEPSNTERPTAAPWPEGPLHRFSLIQMHLVGRKTGRIPTNHRCKSDVFANFKVVADSALWCWHSVAMLLWSHWNSDFLDSTCTLLGGRLVAFDEATGANPPLWIQKWQTHHVFNLTQLTHHCKVLLWSHAHQILLDSNAPGQEEDWRKSQRLQVGLSVWHCGWKISCTS